jgi:hypothetical protein
VIRVLAFIKRRPDVSRDAFRAHYEGVHVPTALPLLAGTAAYVRHHLREELHGVPEFDCMTAFDYPDPALLGAVLARVEGPGGAAVRADELSFMDTAANFFFAVEEDSAWPGAAPAAAAELVVCVRRPASESESGFRERFAQEGVPALLGSVEGAHWSRPQWPRAGGGQPARFDAVVQLGATGPGELADWARAWEARGARVVAARVSAHATEMARARGGPR